MACAPDDPRPRRPHETTSSTSSTTTVPLGDPFEAGGITYPVTARLEASGPLHCADPGEREAIGMWRRSTLPAQSVDLNLLHGGGLAIFDLDGDERLDILIPSDNGIQLWLGRPDGTYVSAWDRLPPMVIDRAAAASVADYDGDGDFDVYVAQDARQDYLLMNDRGVLVDVTTESGVNVDERLRSMGASWADWDGDGDLDLSVPTYSRTQANLFLENQGDGTFEPVDLLGPDWIAGLAFQLVWHDLEHDGFPDLFVLNDHVDQGPQSVLFANRGGVFTLDPGSGYHPNWHGMGMAIADFDGDLVPDLAETSWKNVGVLFGTEVATADQGLVFVDGTEPWGLAIDRIANRQRFAWGIDSGDLDLDGDDDLVATWGHWEAGDPQYQILEQADSTWLNEGDRFTELPPHDYEPGRGMLLVDLNHDGHLDLVKRFLEHETTIDLGTCTDGSWLGVQVRDHDQSMNRFGIGVEVRVETPERTHLRWIEAGSRSMFSGAPPQVHFGLGQAEHVDKLVVRWPDGREAVFTDLEPRQNLVVSMFGPAD